ncbi:hypothetical protein D9611_014191 [Ephemerocybe angulata]|uniref:NAD(P)-binding protein n=1 Tax=Ephemerocybe angulata TaxID=980116 RepID=A0A8H5CAS8_9AGAR|nr:hypothetical protein D9611_014191 [Tulosesus angulatus]
MTHNSAAVKPKGPAQPKSFNLEVDLVDMKGKVVIVTGGNKGIGFEAVRHLLRAGTAKVYLGARSEERAREAIKALHDEGFGQGGKSEVIWLKLDLSDPREVKKAAEAFLEKEGRLDVLRSLIFTCIVNNAADYISPYVLTQTLLPLLKKAAQEAQSDVRIVNVVSNLYAIVPTPVKFNKPEDFNIRYPYRPFPNAHRYGHTKLAMILWSRQLQSQLVASESLPNGITVLTLHPGAVDTFSNRAPPILRGLAKYAVSLFAVEPEMGAYTSVFAAASKKIREEHEMYQVDGGVYLVSKPVPGTRDELNANAKDDKLKENLIKITEEFLKRIGL